MAASRFACWTTALLVAAEGCTPSVTMVGGGGQGGGRSEVTFDEACQAYAEGSCSYIDRCLPFIAVDDPSRAACVARELLFCKQLVASVGVTATPEQIQVCGNAESGRRCDSVGIAECELTGSLADGAPCSDDFECRSGRCFVDRSCPPGQICPFKICGICETPKSKGQECKFGECAGLLVCNDQGVCVDWVPIGQACDPKDDLCEEGFCSAEGICENFVPLGGSCPSFVACDEANLLVCNAETNTCVKQPVVGPGRAAPSTGTP